MKKSQKRSRLVDTVVILLLPLAATIASELLQLNFLWSTVLFFGVPSVYLALRFPNYNKKTLVFSLPVFFVIYFVFDYLAWAADVWYVPNSLMRFLNGAIPFEDGVWGIFWPFFIIMVWETLVKREKNYSRQVPQTMKYFLLLCAVILAVFFTLYFIAPQFLVIRFFYFKLMVVFGLVPFGVGLYKFPHLLPKLLILTSYFFIVSALTEFVGLRHNQWYFGTDHLLPIVSYIGYPMPLEEPLAWWLLGSPVVAIWYELFTQKIYATS